MASEDAPIINGIIVKLKIIEETHLSYYFMVTQSLAKTYGIDSIKSRSNAGRATAKPTAWKLKRTLIENGCKSFGYKNQEANLYKNDCFFKFLATS